MKYKVKAPKHSIGDVVDFIHHNGNIHTGIITYCETHYNKNNYWHIYCINKEGKKTSLWIGEDKIVAV
jgi:hypothetical protein